MLFSADGRAIFTHDQSTLKRWDATKLVETASAPAATHRVAQHPTEGWLAVRDGATTRRLHPKTLRPAGPPLNTAGRLFAFSPCGRSLVVADGRSVWVWDLAGDRQAQRLRAPDEEYAHPSGVSDLALSPDGTLLATASDTTRSVRLWDLVSGRLLAEVPIGAGETRLAFDPRGASFAVLADDRALVYEVSRRHEQAVAARRPFPLQGLAMAADGPLACVSEGPQAGHGEVSFWAEPNPARAPDRGFAFAPADPGAAYPLALSADGRWLGVAGAGGRNLTLHDTRGEAGPKTAALTADTRSLAFAPDGRLWAAVGEEVRAWDVPSLEAAASWKNSLGLVVRGVSAMRAVSAGRRWVVAAGQDGIARVFPAGRGSLTPAASRELSRLPLRSVALSPDETLAVVGSDTGQRWLLRVPSAEVVAELPASGDAVEALAWAPNDLVASGCRNGKVTVYRREGDRLSELLTARHPRSLRGLSFDGRRLAVLLAGERGVRVWHLDRLRQRLVELGLGAGLEVLGSQSSDPG
ncbi:MAG: WD40 repeat domain-containing protein [Gemmataceae bacterium]